MGLIGFTQSGAPHVHDSKAIGDLATAVEESVPVAG